MSSGAEALAGSRVSRQHAVEWVDRYGEAWRLQDVDRILALFTETAQYVERPYDPENGIYRGHAGIKNYWITHIQARERSIEFRNISEDLVFDEHTQTAVAKWEASFEVRQSEDRQWKKVQFLQVAKLRFAPDGRVWHLEEPPGSKISFLVITPSDVATFLPVLQVLAWQVAPTSLQGLAGPPSSPHTRRTEAASPGAAWPHLPARHALRGRAGSFQQGGAPTRGPESPGRGPNRLRSIRMRRTGHRRIPGLPGRGRRGQRAWEAACQPIG